jgi:hypothetical protein
VTSEVAPAPRLARNGLYKPFRANRPVSAEEFGAKRFASGLRFPHTDRATVAL